MRKEQEEKIRNHVRKIPCFTCIVRPICIEITRNGSVTPRNPCDLFVDWIEKRDEITEYPVSSAICEVMELESLEILRKEKRRIC
jgi:hypothetical protein